MRMIMCRLAVALLTSGLAAGAAESGGPLRVNHRPNDKALDVFVGEDLFTSYRYADNQKYPYFFPVAGPASGVSVTTETSRPYPHHHSLFFACDRVNGGNYWQEGLDRGRIASGGPEVLTESGARVAFRDECLWERPGAEPVFRDVRHVTVSAPSGGVRYIDFAVTLEALVDVTILKTNHALFSARMAPELSVEAGGTLVNADGGAGEEGTWGVASPWCDYSGARNGTVEGLAILQHPSNRWYPAPWFTRNYGFFSPTPMFWLEGDRLDMPAGETLSLRYRVVVHAGDAAEADIAEHFTRFAQEEKE